MLSSAMRCRYSARSLPTLNLPAISALRDAPLSQVLDRRGNATNPEQDTPSLKIYNTCMREGQPKTTGPLPQSSSSVVDEAESNKENPVEKVFGTGELLDMILTFLDPREAVRVRCTSAAFHNAVEKNSKIEQRLLRHVAFDAHGSQILDTNRGADDWVETWREWRWIEVSASTTVDPDSLVPWHQILGDEWTINNRVPHGRHEYTVTAGKVFGSFFMDLRAMCHRPFEDLPADMWPAVLELMQPSCAKVSFLCAHYLVERQWSHDVDLHPRLLTGAYHQTHASAQIESTRPKDWINIFQAIARFGPGLRDSLRFCSPESTEHTKYLRQQKCFFDDPWSTHKNNARILITDPLYKFDLEE